MAKSTAGASSRWWERLRALLNHRRPGQVAEPDCSLCRRPQSVAGRLLEGCGNYLCAHCVASCQAVAAGQGVPPPGGAGSGGRAGNLGGVAAAGCAFCHKPAGLVRKLVGTPQLAICNECLARARLIFHPPPVPLEPPPDPILILKPGRSPRGAKRL